MPRLLLFALTIALLAFGALAAACGDDGQGDTAGLEHYFRQVEKLVNDVAEDGDALLKEAFTDADLPSEEAEIEASSAYLSGFSAIISAFADDMRELDPPDAVREAHDAFVEAADDFAKATQDVVDRLDGVTSLAALEELSSSPALDAAGEGVEQACLDLEAAVGPQKFATDLNCSLE